MTIPERSVLLGDLLRRRILVLDGAMGTMIQGRGLTAADFGGPQYEGCNEQLNLTRPDVIADIHAAYIEAGADLISTNTFGCAPYVLAEYGLAERCHDITLAAARICRAAVDRAFTADRPRFAIGAMGPGTRTISVTANVTFEEVRDAYYRQARALIEGGMDALLLETCQDTLNVKAAAIGVRQAMTEAGVSLPLMVSGTVEPMGTMLAGQDVDALYASLEHLDLFSSGLNCATGPEFMTDHLRTLSNVATCFISVYPNAGLPDEHGHYEETAESLAHKMRRFVDEGWVNVVGGCCGTTPDHTRALAGLVAGRVPRVPASDRAPAVSGIGSVYPSEDLRPVIVGERTNVIGSRRFKELIVEEKFEEASEVGRAQVRGGAQVLDVCLANPDRDEAADMDRFMDFVTRKVKAPLMIDSTDARVLELALRKCQGKALVNSINLEDGEERFELVVPLIRTYGAAVVVGCIDEDKQQGMAVTRQRKLAVAERTHELLTGKYGVPERDLIFDPLVFPVGTGDVNYVGSAVETIEGVRAIKTRFPNCKTILGISNVSFGLPAAGREVLNAVFLYECTKAGLDYAIVNSERLERYASIPEEERRLSQDLIYWRGADPVAAFAAHFRGRTRAPKDTGVPLPLDERLARYIVEGSKEGLLDDLALKLEEMGALDIINGPLMKGMGEVGRFFNGNQLIVAEVLQSAEAMKASVAYLEQFMAKDENASRGTIVLATVKGDVHDIGKNLVEIILKNNGYRIVNLGIKVPPEDLIAAYHTHKPDAIGLSGLLVKSAQQMVTTASDLKDAGIEIPMLVGGAALSAKFTQTKIAPSYGRAVCYAKDAMTGLRLMNELMDPSTRETVVRNHTSSGNGFGVTTTVSVAETPKVTRSPKVRTDLPIPPVQYLDRKVRLVPDLREVWGYINPFMLFGRHMGFRGDFEKRLAERDPKAVELFENMEEVKREAAEFMRVRAVWQFFEAEAEGEALHLFAPGATAPLHTFRFGRQRQGDFLCLSDYVLPAKSGQRDHLALFVVTAGEGIRGRSEKAKNEGYYFKSHGLQALAIETAEACAEWLHRRIREDWGFPDPPELTMAQRFTSRYRGKRYSFGYPACPDLEDQAGLWKLLRPEEIS